VEAFLRNHWKLAYVIGLLAFIFAASLARPAMFGRPVSFAPAILVELSWPQSAPGQIPLSGTQVRTPETRMERNNFFQAYINEDHDPDALETSWRIPKYLEKPKPEMSSLHFARDLDARENGQALVNGKGSG
jgi:hypothetical protein